MKQPHPLPRRDWLGVGFSLLVVIAAAPFSAWDICLVPCQREGEPS